MSTYLLPLLVTLWLGLAAFFDLRLRAVSNWLTLPVLASALLWGFLRGEWTVALLVLLLIAVSDLPFGWGAAAALGLIALFQLLPVASFTPNLLCKSLALLGIWGLWRLGLMGGADAKVLLALTLAFGIGILLTILVSGGVIALVARVRRQRTMPYLFPVFLGSTLYFLGNLVFQF